MQKIVKADRDSYISNRVIKGVRQTTANVGSAGTLDLYKLYGSTYSGSIPNTELTRILIHFDLDPIRNLISDGKLDTSNSSFNAKIKMFDVYGGQPTPDNFVISVHALSRSFEEGLGRDVVYLSDRDTCNFLSGTVGQGPWLAEGCGLPGGLPGQVDYITASVNVFSGASLISQQSFVSGEEDLEIDVTTVISATLAGIIPDEGFRISFEDSLEANQRSYFVKRFSSRTAYNSSKHPRLIVKFDDSIQDDSQNFFFDSENTLFLYNRTQSRLSNIKSGSYLTPITGSNSLILKLETEVSGGVYTLSFSGSQHSLGSQLKTGIYSASVYIPSTDLVLTNKLNQSGSVKLTPIWGSIDGTVAYTTGSSIFLKSSQIDSEYANAKRYVISAHNLQADYANDQISTIRVHIFDSESKYIKPSRVPLETPGIVIRDVFYQIRNDVTKEIVIPFDADLNSTKLSSDSKGMFFLLDTSNLDSGNSYIVDIMIRTGTNVSVYNDVSSIFRVNTYQT